MKYLLFAGFAFLAIFSMTTPVANGQVALSHGTTGAGAIATQHVVPRPNAGPGYTIAWGGQGTSESQEAAARTFVLNGIQYVETNNGAFAEGTAPAVNGAGANGATSYVEGTPLTAQIQAILRQQGYYLGQVDGIEDLRTEQSIEAYQRDHHLAITGQISGGLIDAMVVQ